MGALPQRLPAGRFNVRRNTPIFVEELRASRAVRGSFQS
jgi:hypothetical protein